MVLFHCLFFLSKLNKINCKKMNSLQYLNKQYIRTNQYCELPEKKIPGTSGFDDRMGFWELRGCAS